MVTFERGGLENEPFFIIVLVVVRLAALKSVKAVKQGPTEGLKSGKNKSVLVVVVAFFSVSFSQQWSTVVVAEQSEDQPRQRPNVC